MDGLDPHSRLVLKFVTKCLLERESFKELAPFVPIFTALQTEFPGFLPPLAIAMIDLQKCDLSSKDIASIGDGLTLTQQTAFYNSKLYIGFMKARFCAHLEEARKDHSARPEDRLRACKQLLTLCRF